MKSWLFPVTMLPVDGRTVSGVYGEDNRLQ